MNILEVDNSLLTFSGVFKISFSCLKQIKSSVKLQRRTLKSILS